MNYMEEQTLLVDGYPIVVRYGEKGCWKHDLVEIYDALDDLNNPHIASLVNYIYEEGYIVDRRIQINIIDEEGNTREFKP